MANGEPGEMLQCAFPGLVDSDFSITSQATSQYNCIAWAAGDDGQWWEPAPAPDAYWPAECPRQYTVEAYIAAYSTVGFAVCEDGEVEAGFDRIALFTNADGEVKHAARQQPSGRWTSKLGNSEDIEHELYALEGDLYGQVAIYMRCPCEGPAHD